MGQKSHNAGQRGGLKGKYNPGGYNQKDYDGGYSKVRGERHGNRNKYENSHQHRQNQRKYDEGWKEGYKNYKRNNDSSCFVATACYGNCNAPEVLVLRQFRDEKLRKTFYGNIFIKVYYFVSPFFARLISRSLLLKNFIRCFFLEPIVIRLKRNK